MQKLTRLALAATLAAAGAGFVTSASAQANEQFFPQLTYRTGAYAAYGIPWSNGKVDYLKLVNARDGGVNGVKLTYEECETAYATDRGVECYERLKTRPGVAVVDPLATGITFALTEKTAVDKIPLMTQGYGLSISQDGNAFQWNFPFLGSYWTAADILIQHLGKQVGGLDKLKGKKIAYVYHDSPYGKDAIPLLEKRAQMHGFTLQMMPVTAPGVEQKSTWLQIRQSRPDYLLLWGWGVMNSTALKEAQATVNEMEAEMIALIAAEKDPNSGKAAFSNAEARAAELTRRKANDPSYRSAALAVKSAEEEVNAAQFDLERLYDEFRAYRYVVDLTARELALLAVDYHSDGRAAAEPY